MVAYTVSGIGRFTGEDLVIPRKYNNRPVIKIKDDAFKSIRSIKKIVVSNSIEYIGRNSFAYSSSIEQLSLNARTTRESFLSCSNIKEVIIGKNVTGLGADAFNGCSRLTDVTIYSENLTWGAYPFINCNNLEIIKINEDNEKYKTINGVVFSKDEEELILYPPGKKGNYAVPNGVKEIGNRAFLTSDNLNEKATRCIINNMI